MFQNLNWLREDDETGPMQRRRDDALRAKQLDPAMDHRFVDEYDHDRNKIQYSPVDEDGLNGQGHVDPSSAVFQGDTQMQDSGFESYYADPDINGDIPRLGKKRVREDEVAEGNPRRKKKKQKKKEEEVAKPRPPQNVSGKQYQKEVERKLLEEAKRNDRMILVMAKMKSKSKIVRLPLPSDLLEAVQQRPGAQRPVRQPLFEEAEPEPPTIGRSILQSDILPQPSAAAKSGEKPKAPTSFRVRVVEDESYGARKRNPDSNATSKVGRPGHRARRYEEVTIDSDEDLGYDDLVEDTGIGNGLSKARSSAWLARKNEGEEDLPTELPADFRDGMVNPRSEKDRERDRERERERRERRKTMPQKPKPKKAGARPPGRPRKSTGNISDNDGIHEDDDNNGAMLLAQSAAAALEASRKAEEERLRLIAAEEEAAENLRAKMALFDGGSDSGSVDGADEANENIDDLFNDFAAADDPLFEERVEPEPKASPITTPRVTGPPAPPRASILEQASAAGKKIKIVGSKRNGETTRPVTTSSTTINRPRPKLIDLSDDSETEDEIPAKAPPPKTPIGRPPGRPSLVPTRGSSSGKRGRGRPRKTM